MAMSYKVGDRVPSLSADSINRNLAKALFKLAPPKLLLGEVAIGRLPLHSRDYDADFPPGARAFKGAGQHGRGAAGGVRGFYVGHD